MIKTMLMYVLICSASLLYGIGLKNLIHVFSGPVYILVSLIKSLLTVLISIMLTWFVVNRFLVPYDAGLLFPLFAMLFSAFFSLLLQRLIFSLFKINTIEYMVGFLALILALSEGISLEHSIIIGLSAVLSFYALIPVILAIRKRMKLSKDPSDFHSGAVIFISMALIIIALYGWNVSWLNMAVLK